MRQLSVLLLALCAGCSASASKVLDECAAREMGDEARAPRTVTFGDPPLLSVSIPEDWSIDFANLRTLEKGELLDRVEAHLKDSECGTSGYPQLSIEQWQHCATESDLAACIEAIAQETPYVHLTSRPVHLPAGRALEVVGEGMVISDFHGGGSATHPIAFHLFLIATPNGVVSCLLEVGPPEYEQYRGSVDEFCRSIRLL